MVSSKSKAAREFVHFLAEISHPDTGTISCIRLAAWLGMTEKALCKRWIKRGVKVPWPQFVDELLGVLDAAQAQVRDLEQAIDWYLHAPIEQCGRKTADELVVAGCARRLAHQLHTHSVWVHAAYPPPSTKTRYLMGQQHA